MAVLTEDIRDKLIGFFNEIAEEEGLEVFDLTLARRRTRWNIRVTLDRFGGYVTVDDCARLSRRFVARLELERLFTDGYGMEVSSPGLNRPLRNARDYARFIGETAKLVVVGPPGSEVVIGRIKGVSETSVTLSVNDEERVIDFAAIKKANLDLMIPAFGVDKKERRRRKKRG